MNETVIISFPDEPKDKANVLAERLRSDVKRLAPEVETERQRESGDAQDFGATVAVVVTSAAVTALAKGVANLISKYRTKVTVKIGNTYIEATGIESKDASAIVKALQGRS